MEKTSDDFIEYDKEVSTKMKDLILNIIKYKENININLSECSFHISTPDIKTIKSYNNSSGKLYNDDNYLEIVVNKLGFSISHGYNKRSRYKDENILNELLPIIESRVSEINRENFTEIWETILKDSGIMRDNNLNNLFNE